MRKICEWSKCKELASGQGLIKKDINKQYKWFCGDHLKIHNKTNEIHAIGRDVSNLASLKLHLKQQESTNGFVQNI